MNEITIFENTEFGKIRVIDKDGIPWFVASDVSFILGFSEASAMTRNLDDDEKGLSNEQTLGGEQSVIIINESGLYSAILRSRKTEAKAFKKWVTSEVLPAIRKNGSYTIPGVEVPKKESFELELIGLKYVTEILEMASVSRLGLVHKAYDKHKVDKSLLPVYVEKKRLTFSASKLLADLGKPLSAVAFNKLMISEGYLEERSRPSSNGTTKTFKTLTTKGLEFGENLVSPKNDRETHPCYFEDSFKKLVDLLLHSGSDSETDSE